MPAPECALVCPVVEARLRESRPRLTSDMSVPAALERSKKRAVGNQSRGPARMFSAPQHRHVRAFAYRDIDAAI